MTIAALIVAAGRGSRAQTRPDDLAKQYILLNRTPVLLHTLKVFLDHEAIDIVRVVIHPADECLYADAIKECDGGGKLLPPVHGGGSRQESVHLGLQSLANLTPDQVLIHDAARPFVDAGTIARVIAALETSPAAIAATQVADTLKRAAPSGHIAETIDRQRLWRAQTPQGFAFSSILEAHKRAASAGLATFTDDAGIAEWAGLNVMLVQRSEANVKITTAEDLQMAATRLNPTSGDFETRTGTGYDVHRFTAGDHVWLCGVKIPHSHKLEGHSDADVALHALTDALLGAIGDGDIGQHFPPSDAQWKGAASRLFLADAARRIRERGGVIINVDITLLAEAPRIGPHRQAMQHVIGEVLGICTTRVGIKATTNEGLGFIGRREGLAAMASATVRLPASP